MTSRRTSSPGKSGCAHFMLIRGLTPCKQPCGSIEWGTRVRNYQPLSGSASLEVLNNSRATGSAFPSSGKEKQQKRCRSRSASPSRASKHRKPEKQQKIYRSRSASPPSSSEPEIQQKRCRSRSASRSPSPDDCTFCADLRAQRISFPISEKISQTTHVDVSLLNQRIGQKKFSPKEKILRGKFVRDLEKRISALRNGQGGAVFVHIDNFDKNDKNIDSFNELVDPKLQSMIDDGNLFVDIFRKKLAFPNDSAVIGITVQPTTLLSTLNFNTKIPLDFEIKDPLSDTVFAYVKRLIRSKEEDTFSKKSAKLRGVENIEESRSQQVKCWFTKEKEYSDKLTPEDFTEHIWTKLRLREYISAFTKVDGGGSFYVGISEVTENYKESNYTSKRYQTEGFCLQWQSDRTRNRSIDVIDAHNQVKELLKSRLEKDTIVLKADGKYQPPDSDIIEIEFHKVGKSQNYILEVAVAAIDGILFYDHLGPESYVILGGEPHRLSIADWYKRLTLALDSLDPKPSIGVVQGSPLDGTVNDIKVASFCREHRILKQVDNCLGDIQNYVLKQGISVYPRYFLPQRTFRNLKSRCKEFSSEGLAYVAQSLAVSANLGEGKVDLKDIKFDVFLLMKGMPLTVLTVIDNGSDTKNCAKYNSDVAKQMVFALRRYTIEHISCAFGVVQESDLSDTDDFKDIMKKILEESTAFATPESLNIPLGKYKILARAFLMVVASTSFVRSQEQAEWFLTLNQFKVLTENLDREEIFTNVHPGSGGKVLLFEVARRFERFGPTLIISDREDIHSVARKKKVCSEVVLLKNVGRGQKDFKNVVLYCNREDIPKDFLCASHHQKLWIFHPVKVNVPYTSGIICVANSDIPDNYGRTKVMPLTKSDDETKSTPLKKTRRRKRVASRRKPIRRVLSRKLKRCSTY